MLRATILWLVLAGPAVAGSLMPVRTIPSRTVLTAADVTVTGDTLPGAPSRVEDVVGMEARVTLFPGRALRAGDVGPPAAVERNQVVKLRFARGGLSIETDGRALDRAAAGARVRVMNLASRTVVVGRVADGGIVEVGE